MQERSRQILRQVALRVGICVAVLLLGVVAMSGLKNMKKPPTQTRIEERALRVEVITARPEKVPVTITGYGQVRARDHVRISSEVAGMVVAIHPRLETGEVIPSGETLLKIDARDYDALLEESDAAARQMEQSVKRLRTQLAIDNQRLARAGRSRDLAKAEFERLGLLFKTDRVGTQSGVDAAERAFNATADMVDQLTAATQLYPIQIEETQSALRSAQARRKRAEISLSRCEIKAPFTARVTEVGIEKGQYVAPGQGVLSLADDSLLEILVPIDSLDARQWLSFTGPPKAGSTAWFNSVEPVPCRIRWTEDKGAHVWEGRLHRVVAFNKDTRTITVAVRIDAPSATRNAQGFPLVEGMFCSVEIPGRDMQDVFRLPRWAVSFEETVFVSVSNRLKTVDVDVARIQGEETFVREGIREGDVVIVTRLVNPLEDSLLDVGPTTHKED